MALMEEDFLFSLKNVELLITLIKTELQNYKMEIEGILNRTIESIVGRAYKKVDQLPSSGSTEFIYLVSNDETEENNVYDEYFWDPDKNKFELFGTTKIKLDDYLKIIDIVPLEETVSTLESSVTNLLAHSVLDSDFPSSPSQEEGGNE